MINEVMNIIRMKYRLKKLLYCTLICVATIPVLAGCSDINNKYEETFVEEETTGLNQVLSKEQALDAIKKYCYEHNPDLEAIVNEGQYLVYWDVSSFNDEEIVILFRSYTGAQKHYYIDRDNGYTYVTEYVPGITEDEVRTQEELNVKDYLN